MTHFTSKNGMFSSRIKSNERRLFRLSSLAGASTLALCLGAPLAFSQETGDNQSVQEAVIVTGIRGSLRRAQDIKRNSDGVVDSISLEDIGKFPDTNLAESLQRIAGVAINRVNGEGSQVTVRGFGAEFNLVTLNGRSLPGADVALVGGDRNGASVAGNTRAFDFSNLASEAVSGIDVYKTGNATISSGGIGATVDVRTSRPLDNPGLQASFGVKGVADTSVVNGSNVTPEVNGIISWTDASERFGIGAFGSFQQRDSAAASGSVLVWQTFEAGEFLNNAQFVNADTVIVNAPTDPNQLVGIAIDSRLHFSDFERERLNLGGVVQFKPVDNFLITADVLYARNDNIELRSDVANWFGTTFTEVIFDTGQPVATAQSLSADFVGDNDFGTKDFALEQDSSATRDELTSFGLNLQWDATDRLRFEVDGHISQSEVSPLQTSAIVGDVSRITVAAAAPFVQQQTQLFLPGQAPVQFETIDTSVPDGVEGFSINDIGSTFQTASLNTQDNQINEINIKGSWEAFDDLNVLQNGKITAGFNYRDQENTTFSTNQQQFLGFFDASIPGDIGMFAPGILQSFCLTCQFTDFPVGATDESGTTFRPASGQDLVTLFDTLSPIFANAEGTPGDLDPRFSNILNPPSIVDSTVQEEIISLFAQFDSDFTLLNRPGRLSVGLRYEDTDVTSSANFTAPLSLTQTDDNDFILTNSEESVPLELTTGYNRFLPHANFSFDLTEDLVIRAAYSRTIARAGFGQLSAQVAGIGTPSGGPSALGAPSVASQGNPLLIPIDSNNFDLSLEWYYGESSFVSIGGFHKIVDNFIGTGTNDVVLFPTLFDPTSGAPGSRSGDALSILTNLGTPLTPSNLFLLTTLLDDFPAAQAQQLFVDNLGVNGADSAEDPSIAGLEAAAIAAGGDLGAVTGNATDDPVLFTVTQPVNNQRANISGLEVSAQHFFWDTGFGFAASYTLVEGDIGFDVTAPVGADQFALTGLSDTANVTAIYEKYGVSARLSYNWRDQFLSQTNRGDGFDTPIFVDAFGQLDLNLSYDLTENIVLSFEGINLTGENLVTFGRSESQVVFAQELAPRFLFGARYRF